ncbi:hypothetical protein [Fictibacillus gelatini]|uniref:hypothetical protein n=1 Tax=Fictibacillus gelatini TaxID=225985 RepID=UPI00041F1E80|nr:hypothetical protein [Fictibacillus gelatini]
MSDITVIMANKERLSLTSIENSPQAFEDVVGGPVDLLNFYKDGYKLVCHIEEGYNLYYNHIRPKRPFFVVKFESDFKSLTDAEAKEVKEALREKMKKWH